MTIVRPGRHFGEQYTWITFIEIHTWIYLDILGTVSPRQKLQISGRFYAARHLPRRAHLVASHLVWLRALADRDAILGGSDVPWEPRGRSAAGDSRNLLEVLMRLWG